MIFLYFQAHCVPLRLTQSSIAAKDFVVNLTEVSFQRNGNVTGLRIASINRMRSIVTTFQKVNKNRMVAIFNTSQL